MSASDKLVYSGEKATFAGWKDKLKAHLMAKSDALEVTELQAGRQEPVARYEDALVRETVLPELKPDATDAEKGAYALQRAFVRRQASYVTDLLSQTLPSGAISEALMQRPVHVIWGSIEKRFGLNTASDTPASPAVSLSPPSSLQTPLTPGSSDLLDVEPMDTDELMSEFDIGANAGRMEMAREI
uniref:Uncharacterized protein n=1 Tax=Phytophthora fragariae TaxID=53985 RepID=A0A6A3DMD1_9STRA|nr:hypothetical protein PF009_g27269 [Phytophthora fragariae]